MDNQKAGNPRILFLDDDHVLRILKWVLSNKEHEPATSGWFAPERPDFNALANAAMGLRLSEGALIGGAELEDAEIIILRRGKADAELMRRHPSLRLIQRLGSRADDIDLTTARRRGILVSCMPRRTLNFTAEHSLLLMMALSRLLLQSDEAVRAGTGAVGDHSGEVAYNWAGVTRSKGLYSSTLGIIGLGEVGSLLARLAGAVGMRVLYYKPKRADPAQERALNVTYAPLEELLAQADHVSLHAADIPENRGLAGREFFSRMKSTAYFINTSRGQLVDEDALYDALIAGRIAGAGLDVHAAEPRSMGDRFSRLPNVVLTPHLAGGARSGVLDEFQTIVSNCHAALSGQPLQHQV